MFPLSPPARRARSLIAVAAAAAAGLLGVSPAACAGDGFPQRPVQMVVPFPAGGTTDIIGRSVGQQLGARWGQPIVLENRGGAGGNIGTEFVIKAAADGYTWSINTAAPMAINPHLYDNLAFDPLDALVPMVRIADVQNVLVVNNDVPAATLDEFIAYARSRREPMFYGSTGVGTAAHLTGFMMAQRAGFEATHVPYRGAAALTDLIGGRVQFMFATLPSVIGHLRDGKLRALAVSSAKRSKVLPDLKTVAEQGFPGFDTGTWYGLFAPKGTPRSVIDKVNKDVNDILADPAVQRSMLEAGAEPAGGYTPEQFGEFVRGESDRWREIVKTSGATAS